eukprot:TRINITY_DN27001_c0_g1_i1.p1 TRINITY_DN27001_c0_g1~~TRINITY_DN27001_c0_g1_i1.p1  ORF type:complete len:1202 (+),score=250.45 TRINITY_DN27001_c0_g1_i1:53-3658(+)
MAAASPDSRLPTQYNTLDSEDDKSVHIERAQGRGGILEKHRWLCAAAACLLLLGGAAIFLRQRSPQGTLTVAGPIELYALDAKPKADRRSYQYHMLPNGLAVLNIQDQKSTQMAMAMAVRAGSFDDPENLPGLAHFCEHMLFLGTEKYPESGGFDTFLSKNGGSSNAYTANEVTVYFASASKHAAREGLDRFADFFRAPLFNEKFVKKEVHAIDSEHQKNLQDNGRRVFELLNSLADPRSVVPRFATGDFETLYEVPKRNGTSTVEALKTYFQQRYCPGQMRLVTFGPDTLKDQLGFVQEAGFGQLPEGDEICTKSARNFSSPAPFPPERMGHMLTVKGTEETGQLWLRFQLPDLSKEFASQPFGYLDYTLKYGGQDSLFHVLKTQLGLISSFSTEADPSSTGTGVFVVFRLTPLGFEEPQAVLDVFFGYLASLRRKGVDEGLYESLKDMYKLSWDWEGAADAEDAASGLAEAMTRLPKDKLLTGDSLIEEQNPALVQSLIGLLTPSNMNLALVAPASHGSKLFRNASWPVKTLPHYGVQYVDRPLAMAMPDALERWSAWLNGQPALDKGLRQQLRQRLVASNISMVLDSVTLPPRVPDAIDGIPKHVSLKHMNASEEASVSRPRQSMRGSENELLSAAPPPSIVEKSFGPVPVSLELGRGSSFLKSSKPSNDVWFRSGWITKSPKVKLELIFRTLDVPEGPESKASDEILLSIYNRLLSEEIGPELFDLTASGSTYGLTVEPHGLGLSFDGFEEALPNLIAKVLKAFNRFNEERNATHPERFARITKAIKQDLQTFSDMPVRYAQEAAGVLLSRNSFSQQESLTALDEIINSGNGPLSATSAAGNFVLSRELQTTALVMGNLASESASDALANVTSGLQKPSWVHAVPSPEGARVNRVPLVVNPNVSVEVRATNPRSGDPNDVALVMLLWGVWDVQSRVMLGILSSLLRTTAFEELRTQRQLGYVVSAGTGLKSNVLYVVGMVQGTKLDADNSEAALEGLFTNLIPRALSNMSEQDFQQHVDAYRQQLLSPPLGTSEELDHFWEHIKTGGKCMHLLDEALSFMKGPHCNKQLAVDMWERLAFGKKSDGSETRRQKISVKFFAAGNVSAEEATVPKRPSLEAARKAWDLQGVAPRAVEMLTREWHEAKVVDRADSQVRQELARDGGYFPQDLRCHIDESVDGTSDILHAQMTQGKVMRKTA